MPRRGLVIAGLLVLALAMLAGCLGDKIPQSTGKTASDPPMAPLLFVGECNNALLFQFVEYGDTDAYLPPGFHPRDPQAFIGSPAAFGRAGVLLIALDCHSDDGERYAAAAVAIFVEAPLVEGLDSARFNFYEVERVAPPGPLTSVLAGAEWPMVAGEVYANITLGDYANTAAGSAEAYDDKGRVAFFGGSMDAPLPLGNATVRFWHDGPRGLAYVEYAADLQPLFGTGVCFLRQGSAMAIFAKSTPAGNLEPVSELNCPPGEPLIATFPHLRLNATAASLPGVHAQ